MNCEECFELRRINSALMEKIKMLEEELNRIKSVGIEQNENNKPLITPNLSIVSFSEVMKSKQLEINDQRSRIKNNSKSFYSRMCFLEFPAKMKQIVISFHSNSKRSSFEIGIIKRELKSSEYLDGITKKKKEKFIKAFLITSKYN